VGCRPKAALALASHRRLHLQRWWKNHWTEGVEVGPMHRKHHDSHRKVSQGKEKPGRKHVLGSSLADDMIVDSETLLWDPLN
jgi:hypothetical protein